MNFTEVSIKHTRIIEHKFFKANPGGKNTIITKEFPANYKDTGEAYYPINDSQNMHILSQYKQIKNSKYLFGGRLAEYRYYDMDQTVGSALAKVEKLP